MAATSAASAAATTAATVAVATNVATPTPLSANAGYLGISGENVQACGISILQVKPGTPAETAKLQIGDVIVAIDNTPITSVNDLRTRIQNHKAGDSVVLTYQRSSQNLTVTVTLSAVPPTTSATQVATAASTAAALPAVTLATAAATK